MAGEAAAVIGKSVQIRGEVKGNEDLLVDGLVEGTISLTDSRLTIGSHANVQANLTARDVVVLGTLVGDIQAAGRVELRAEISGRGGSRSKRTRSSPARWSLPAVRARPVLAAARSRLRLQCRRARRPRRQGRCSARIKQSAGFA
jgi:hypothetical protein